MGKLVIIIIFISALSCKEKNNDNNQNDHLSITTNSKKTIDSLVSLSNASEYSQDAINNLKGFRGLIFGLNLSAIDTNYSIYLSKPKCSIDSNLKNFDLITLLYENVQIEFPVDNPSKNADIRLYFYQNKLFEIEIWQYYFEGTKATLEKTFGKPIQTSVEEDCSKETRLVIRAAVQRLKNKNYKTPLDQLDDIDLTTFGWVNKCVNCGTETPVSEQRFEYIGPCEYKFKNQWIGSSSIIKYSYKRYVELNGNASKELIIFSKKEFRDSVDNKISKFNNEWQKQIQKGQEIEKKELEIKKKKQF